MRTFDRKFLWLAAPLILQNALRASFHALDSVLIARLGTYALASAGFTSQIVGISLMILFATSASLQPVISQALQTRQYQAQGWVFVRKAAYVLLTLGLLLAVAGYFLLKPALAWGQLAPDVHAAAYDYLLASLPMIPAMAISLPLEAALRAKRKLKVDTTLRIAGLLINALLSVLFIFGLLGFPALGPAGAGLASSISKCLEAIALCVICHGLAQETAGTAPVSVPSGWYVFVRQSIGTLWLQEISWSLIMVLWMNHFARLGTDSLALWQMILQIDMFLIWASSGLFTAAGILLSKELVNHHFRRARLLSWRILFVSFNLALSVCVPCYLVMDLVFALFNLPLQLQEQASRLYVCFLLFIPVRVLAMIVLMGILRPGGQFFWPALGEIVLCWLSIAYLHYLTLTQSPTETTIYLVIQCTWAGMLICYVILYRSGRWLRAVESVALPKS